MSDPDLAVLRREMDRVQQERLTHLETRLDELDRRIDVELRGLDERIQASIQSHEALMLERSATLAVRRAFWYLGVDVESPTELQRFRDDLRFGGVFRDAATKGFFAVIAAICGGIGLSVWLAFKDRVGLP